MGTIKRNISQNNAELSAIFHRMASCYRFLGQEERFRALAYDNAARTISNLQDDITVYAKDVNTLDKLSGIGESIGEKIIEYLETGKIRTYEKLMKQVPVDLLELMDINGFGPATIKTLHEKLKVNNRDDLVKALESEKITFLKGFGPKKIENMRRGLKLYKETQARMLLSDAMQTGNEILADVQKIPGVLKAELAGSLRRKKETVGDIDIIITADEKKWEKIAGQFIRLPQADRVLASGDTKASILLKKNKTQVDVRIVHENEFGAALLYFTGSKEHNIKLRTIAKEKGYKINEYGVFDTKSGKKVAGISEEDMYRFLEMQYIEPELREDRGEIETALKKQLPELIEPPDIKGDMQMHSTWSDGAENIETMAKHVLKNFPGYGYIVITDHSPSERIAHGLKPADFREQFLEIDAVNKKLKTDLVKKGVEVDILPDGSMDLPDDLLRQFDWVVASIHSGFTKDNTERLIKACGHPYVHCIGHPSGRLIGKREGYPVNWIKLFEKAAATGTAIEINAQPERLDLKDDLVKMAIEKGVHICISTDAHSPRQLDNMPLGVAVARRGWCTKENVLNSGNWKKIESFKDRKHKARSVKNKKLSLVA